MLQYFEVINEFGKQGHSRQNYLYYYFSIMHATRKKDLQRKPQMCGNAFKCRLLGDAHALMDAIPIPIFFVFDMDFVPVLRQSAATQTDVEKFSHSNFLHVCFRHLLLEI